MSLFQVVNFSSEGRTRSLDGHQMGTQFAAHKILQAVGYEIQGPKALCPNKLRDERG